MTDEQFTYGKFWSEFPSVSTLPTEFGELPTEYSVGKQRIFCSVWQMPLKYITREQITATRLKKSRANFNTCNFRI